METRRLSFEPLGNRERSYRQDKFILSTFQINGREREELEFDDVQRIIKKLKEAHHNQIELGWAHHNTVGKAVKVCEEEGLDVIVQDLSVFGGFQSSPNNEVAVEDDIREFVSNFDGYQCVKGYYVWDEPWKDPDVQKAGELIGYFEKYAPGKHAIAILIPSYNPKLTWKDGSYLEYVDYFSKTVNPAVLSFDYYPYGVRPVKQRDENQLDLSLVWNDLGAIRAEGLRRNIPLWYYYQTLRVYGEFELNFPMVRLQMYYALLYGAKALQSFGATGSNASPMKSEEKRKMLELNGEEGWFYDDIKRECGMIAQMGKTLIALTSTHVYHSNEVLPENEYFNKYYREDISEDPIFDMQYLPRRCSVGTFADRQGNCYAMILNRDYETANTFVLKLKKKYRIYEVSKADGKHYCVNDETKKLAITLEAGSAILVRFQNREEEPCHMEYVVSVSE